jgi:peptide/nickel transport system permease protein
VSRRYALRRLLQVIPTLAVILATTFLLAHAVPGDPAEALAGDGADPIQIAAVREELGLDRPLVDQFLGYSGSVLSGDLGTSYVHRRPVAQLIRERIPATLLLTGTAMALSTVGGLAFGMIAARRPFGWVDLGVSTAALVGYALPVFWLAQLAVLAFALGLGVLPVQGMENAGLDLRGLDRVLDIARHLVLPSLVLAASEVALLTRMTRAGLLQEQGKGYIRTADAKGLERSQVLRRHALPNALLPVVTLLGTRVGFLISGAVLVENVFAWPGLGRLLVESAQSRDYSVVLGMVLLVTFALVVANLVTDLAYARIDPRIAYR